jgi:hypothetical protein
LLALAAPAHALEPVSPLALPTAGAAEPVMQRVAGAAGVPGGLLAQRAIDREWGASEDSVYVEVAVPQWRSETSALLRSALLPGAGQWYVGEGSGWLFLGLEAAAWTGRALWLKSADDRAAEAARFVGDPNDPDSPWSFARYQFYSGADTEWLEQLWARDREAFYATLERSPDTIVGFDGASPELVYTEYRKVRQRRDDQLRRARWAETAIWINHLAAAWDALRAARFHNLPLRRDLPVQFGMDLQSGEAAWSAALVRRF